jgi:signal transduction histidine kinase
VRLGLQTGVLVVGVLVVLGLLMFVTYSRAADESAGDTLDEVTSSVRAPSAAPAGVRMVVVAPRGRRMSQDMPAGFPDERAIADVRRDRQPREYDRTVGRHHYAVRTAWVRGRVVQAVLDRRELDEGRERMLSALLVAGLVGVLLSVVVATYLARRSLQPLTQSLAVQRRFVADASHELRTPLTLLSTRVQLLVREARRRGGSVPVDALDGVLADTGRLTGILEELLVAADTGGAPRSRVDLTRVVEESVGSAQAFAQERGVDLELARPDEAYVDGVEVALRRAVTALVDNALDHARSRVDVEVRAARRKVEVVVVDDGPGLPPDSDPRRLFDRFTSDRDLGRPGARRHYGIGLALVADVAAAHHGSVHAGRRADGEDGAALTLSLERAEDRAGRPHGWKR